jgi:hypothetical protein
LRARLKRYISAARVSNEVKGKINNRLDHCLREIRRTVNHYGGLRYVSDGTIYHLDSDGQLRLFG